VGAEWYQFAGGAEGVEEAFVEVLEVEVPGVLEGHGGDAEGLLFLAGRLPLPAEKLLLPGGRLLLRAGKLLLSAGKLLFLAGRLLLRAEKLLVSFREAV
jgi:hypothetical protein